MSDNVEPRRLEPPVNGTNPSQGQPPKPDDEGGLKPPPGLGFWGRTWWWFHFLILVKIARLRFIAILFVIGLVIVKWDTLAAYYDKWTRSAGEEHAASSDTEYYCPMHPTVIRDNPKEKCPICFMGLSKRKKGEASDEALPPGVVNRVQLSPYRVVLAGIRTWKVQHIPLVKEITTVGYVEFNERELKQVAARVKGRLDKLYVNETGQMVRAGDELASLYSPDLSVTVQSLLDAQRADNPNLLAIQRNRLQLWAIGDDQIDEILRTGKANTHLKIRSPITGHVVKKFVKEGQYVDEGTPLYEVVDLTTVWIQAQIYEDEMAFLPRERPTHTDAKDGHGSLQVSAMTRAFPNEPFRGVLTFIFPHVDQESRTLMVRFELNNPGHKLRPGTSATVTVKVPPRNLEILTRTIAEDEVMHRAADVLARNLLVPGGLTALTGIEPYLHSAIQHALLEQGMVLAVPESAVIDTGSQKIVYREAGPSEYEGMKVELGPRMAGPEDLSYFPVLRGLTAGDMIVTSGSFLVDAETRLNASAGSIYFGGSTGSKGGSASTSAVRPTTPEDEEAKVKAAFAGLASAADRQLAEAQRFCPVLKDSRLGSMGKPIKVMVEGEPVFLCCASCKKGALANPKETLRKVEKLKQAAKGSQANPPR